MDAHTVRGARWKQSYVMEKHHLTLSGFSRAAFRTGFYIKELGIMLDAGPQNSNQPGHIFITHCHADHVAELPFTLMEDDFTEDVQLYGPPKSKKHVLNFIQATFDMSAMAKVTDPLLSLDYLEVTGGETLELNLKNNSILVKVIDCDHAISTVSYLFTIRKKKLKTEYFGLSGREIVKLVNDGIQISNLVETPLFGYICDTSIATVARYEDDLAQYPYLIIECSFLLPDELDNATATKHIHWDHLEPYVAKYPETIWILIHFSLRYKDHEISDFFKEKKLKYPNLKIWVQEEEVKAEAEIRKIKFNLNCFGKSILGAKFTKIHD